MQDDDNNNNIRLIEVQCIYIDENNEISEVEQHRYELHHLNYLSRQEMDMWVNKQQKPEYRLNCWMRYNGDGSQPLQVFSKVTSVYFEKTADKAKRSITGIVLVFSKRPWRNKLASTLRKRLFHRQTTKRRTYIEEKTPTSKTTTATTTYQD